jgi:hypothetical protein
MIYYSKNGYSIDLLCRANDDWGSFYLGLHEGRIINLYFDWEFNEPIPELPAPIEAIKRLLTDPIISNANKKYAIQIFILYCNLNETEQRLSKLVLEKVK